MTRRIVRIIPKILAKLPNRVKVSSMKALFVFGVMTAVIGTVFSLVLGVMVMGSNTSDTFLYTVGNCILVLGPVLSVTFGLCAVALGKMAAAADLLKEKLKK